MTHPGENRLLRYTLDELDEDERAEVDRHLVDCARCAAEVRSEQRLDEWIVATAPTPSAESTRRSLQRLWERVDAEGAQQTPAAKPRAVDAVARRLAWLAVAATLLATAWGLLPREPESAPPTPSLAGDEPAPAAQTEHESPTPSTPTPSTETATPIAPDRLAATPVDAVSTPDRLAAATPVDAAVASDRLAAATPTEASRDLPSERTLPTIAAPDWDRNRLDATRAAVAEVLRRHAARFPFQLDAFGFACEAELEPLRRDGWPVNNLVRGLALGDDDEVAFAALRFAARDPATYGTLAAALSDGPRGDAVLELLSRHPLALQESWALVHAIERRIERTDDRWVRELALSVLGAAAGERPARSFERLVEGALRRIDVARPGAESELLMLADHGPPVLALAALLEAAAATGDPGGRLRERFTALATQSPAAASTALEDGFDEATLRATAHTWSAAARLDAAVAPLLRRLQRDPGEARALATLEQVGGTTVATGLFHLWREHRGTPTGRRLESALAALLVASEELPSRLGARVSDAAVEDLIELARRLPADRRGELLTGSLLAWPQDSAPSGYPAALLAALGRLGAPADAEALAGWIADRPRGDPLLPLAWVSLSQISDTTAAAAWRERGGDPATLLAAADAAATRAVRLAPDSRLLRPVRRALERAGAVPDPTSRSQEGLP